MSSLINFLIQIFHRPVIILGLCMSLSFVTLLLDGSLYHLWNLQAEKREMHQRVAQYKSSNTSLSMKVQQAQKNDQFIEREAKERLDLLKKNELIFIFGDAEQ
jgi:cell division protein FtsB